MNKINKFSNLKPIFTRARVVLVAVVISFFGMFSFSSNTPYSNKAFAQSTDELQAKSAQLQKEIDASNAKLLDLSKQAQTLENRISQLNIEITQINNQIKLTTVRLQQLQKRLDEAKKELEKQKTLLKAALQALYERKDASAVELLMASDSFSQFISSQEYLERLQSAVKDSADKVVKLRDQIEREKNEQQKLLEQQRSQQELLTSKKQEQQSLLVETQGQEARYREITNSLVERQKAINRELLARSRVVVGSGGGGYPWSSAVCSLTGRVDGNCNNYEWIFEGRRRDPWGYYYRNCTSWAAFRSALNGKVLPSGLGNGGNWGRNAPAYNIARGHEPRVGALASFATGGYGHVVYVEEVLGGNQIRISEYNFIADGVYSERVLSASQVSWFIYP